MRSTGQVNTYVQVIKGGYNDASTGLVVNYDYEKNPCSALRHCDRRAAGCNTTPPRAHKIHDDNAILQCNPP